MVGRSNGTTVLLAPAGLESSGTCELKLNCPSGWTGQITSGLYMDRSSHLISLVCQEVQRFGPVFVRAIDEPGPHADSTPVEFHPYEYTRPPGVTFTNL